MRASRSLLAGFLSIFVTVALAPPAEATDALKPFKDELFAYPAVLSSEKGDRYRVVDYRELRDINERDQVPERRVKGEYVSTAVRKVQQDLMLKTDAGDIRHVAVGSTAGAGIIVLYLHGQGGSRKQGADDFTFGGNFNRIKNLMAANGGLYLSPDFSDFGDKGAAQIASLISHYAEASPGAKIFVACGSMGGALCWKLAGRQDTGALVVRVAPDIAAPGEQPVRLAVGERRACKQRRRQRLGRNVEIRGFRGLRDTHARQRDGGRSAKQQRVAFPTFFRHWSSPPFLSGSQPLPPTLQEWGFEKSCSRIGG